MSGKSGLILYVITISLFAFTNASNVGNKTKILCSERSPEYKAAGDQFFSTFRSMVDARLKKEEVDITALRKNSSAFLEAAKTCTKSHTINETWNHNVYLELIEYIMKNASVLIELKEQGQFKCIMEQKDALTACVNASASITTEYQKLMIRTHLNFNAISCARTRTNQNCTLEVLKEECSLSVDFVKGLFDVLLLNENCKHQSNEDLPSGSHRTSAFWATFVMFVVEWAKLVEM